MFVGTNTTTDLPFVFPYFPHPSCFDFSVVQSLLILQHENEGGMKGWGRELTLRGKICRFHLFLVLRTNPFASQSCQKGDRLLIAMFQGKEKNLNQITLSGFYSQRNSNEELFLSASPTAVTGCSLRTMRFQKNLLIQANTKHLSIKEKRSLCIYLGSTPNRSMENK